MLCLERLIVTSVVCLVAALNTINVARAESVSLKPWEVRISTPAYQPAFSDFEPPLGTYTFDVGWQGIPAAEITLNVEQEGLDYRIVAEARTLSGIDLIYKLRYRGEGWISAVDLSPVKSVVYERENSREKRTELKYRDDGAVETARTKNGEPTEHFSFKPENAMLEPFSAAFLARSLPWDAGTERKFDTFNGKTRYLITLKCVGKETIRVAGEQREAWVIEPAVANLTAPDTNSKLRSAQIYLSTDNRKEILKIVSSVFIGSVTTKLAEFKPSPNATSPGVVALRATGATEMRARLQ
jgi:hypothetical protein